MVKKYADEIIERLKRKHIKMCKDRELLIISSTYQGLWLEHVYDAVLMAGMDATYNYLAKNTIEVFIDNQKENGQYPFNLSLNDSGEMVYNFSQVQECVSFLSLALEVCEMVKDEDFDLKVYNSGVKWVKWFEDFRMTLKKGLVEMFVGFDTGHDNSGRLEGLSCKGNYSYRDKTKAHAHILPPGDKVAPVIAVDMNCVFFGNLMALSKLADRLGKESDAKMWKEKAFEIKKKLFEICFDREDTYFYDVDKNGNKRKYLSSTIFHLFQERVLHKEEDKELIEKLYKNHIKDKNKFWTKYPFPSMAVCDESTKNHPEKNCWGYFTQGLIVLRCIRWMDYYGMSEDFDHICKMWVKGWTSCYHELKFGQELDPHTGRPSPSSEWYSSCMLMYLYACKRLKLI